MSVNPILEELKKRGYQVDPNSAYRIGNASGYRRAAAPYVKSYSDLLNERLQLGLQYAQQGPEYKKDLADSISPGGAMTSYKQGDISAFDWDTLKQAEMDRVAANTFYRSVGAFDNTDYAFNKGYVHLTSTDYLKSLLPSLEAARTAWNSGGEEDYLSFIQRNSAVKNKLADMDAQDRNYYDTDALTEADLLWFDQIVNGNERWRPNYASQEDVDRYNSLVDQWASVEDWENFDLAQYLGIEAPKAYDESNYKTIISELERRAALEAMQADIRSNANYSSLSVYSDPGITPKNVSWAADREYEAYVKGYDDLSRFINSGAGWSELMTASDHNATVREYMSKGYDYISADELADYNALINAGRTEEAAQYLELLLPELQYRRAMVLKEYQSVKATNPWLAAPTWVEAGLQGIANVFYLPQQIYETATGKDNPWSSAWDAYNKQQWTGEAQIGAIHDADIPDWLKTVSTYAYQGVAGFRDNAMRILAGGGSPTVSLIIAGLQSGSGSLHESSERDDMSGAAKIIKAIGTAAVEMGTEKVGLDALFSNGKNGALAYMKKVILSEIGEEVLNAASEPVLEAVVAFLFDHEADIMSGPEFWKNLTDTAITTAISSVFMGAGGAVSQDMNTRAAGKDLKENGDLEGVLNIAEAYGDNEAVSVAAKDIRDKQAKGIKVTARDMGELVHSLSNAIGEKNSKVLSDVLDTAIEGRLEELGEAPENAKKLAPALRNVYQGKKLTMAERASLKWTDAASQVLKEMNTETQEGDEQRVGHSWKTAADEKIVAAQREGLLEETRFTEALSTKTSTTTAVGKAHDKAKNLLKGKPKMATRDVMAEGSDGKEVTGTFERVERENGKLLMVMKDADTEIKVDADKITNGGDEGILTIINYAQEGARHEMSTDEINTMVNTYLHEGGDVDSFVQQFQDNYLAGYSGINAPAGTISGGIASIAYEQGKAEAIKDETDRVARAQKARKVETPSVGWLGDVTSDTSIKGLGDAGGLNEAVKNMTETQQAMVEFGRHLAKSAKINVVFFASKAGADGKYTTQNGSYDPNTHTIYLDINSGASTEKGRQALIKNNTLGAAIGRVAGHELTHVLEATSPEYYAKYKQAVKAALKAKNLDYSSLVREKIDAALATGAKLTYAGAEAEVIADASEYMLQDSKFVKNMDQGLKGKVKEIVQKFLNKVNEAFRALTGGHIESAVLRTMTDGVAHYEKQLQDLWDMAFDEMLGAEVRTDAPVAESTGETETVQKSIRERDDAYMAAVERGDMETAQKMVDEAAKAVGYPVKAYHGTPTGGFTAFDRSYIGLNTGVGRGRFSFTSDKGTANAYAKANKGSNASTLVAELNKLFKKHASAEMSELFIGDSDVEVVEFDPDIVIAEGALDHGYIDFDYDWRDETPDKYSSESEAKEAEATATFNGTKLYLLDDLKRMQRGAPANTKVFFEEAIRMLETASMNATPQTYSVYIKKPGTTYSADSSTYNSTAWDAAYDPNDVTEVKLDNGESRYFVASPESIKSADPVTYDDSGNVIPLSERFNAANEDIRYSHRDDGSAYQSEAMTVADGMQDTDGKRMFSLRSFNEDYDTYRAMLMNHNVPLNEINDLFDTIDEVMKAIEKDREILDFGWNVGREDRSFNPVKPNSDPLYEVSLDFSTLCRKRLLQQTVQERLEAMYDTVLTKAERVAIRNELMKLREEGKQIEVACALCYVESTRLKSPAQIQRFFDDRRAVMVDYFSKKNKAYMKEVNAKADELIVKFGHEPGTKKKELNSSQKKAVENLKQSMYKKYKPSAEEEAIIATALELPGESFKTDKGLWNLKKEHEEIFDAYTSFVRNATKSKGIEGDEAWWAGDSKSISDKLIEKMNKENGLRTQSWSDFQVIHLLDYISAIIELSTRGAKMQSYTKVPDFVKLMGDTGVMINLSLIPKGFDGTLNYDPIEGMPIEEALALREMFPNTAGTICIGITKKHIVMLLANPDIDYVIPYHSSSLDKKTRQQMGMKVWEDFQSYQSEKNKDYPNTDSESDKYHKKPLFSEWFDYNTVSERAKVVGAERAMQEAADRYIELCHRRGLQEKFAQFAAEPNYWKLLIDRKMINQQTGEIIKQEAVQPRFNKDRILDILSAEVNRFKAQNADKDAAVEHIVNAWENGEIRKAAKSKKVRDQVSAFNDTVTVASIVASATELDAQEQTQKSIRDLPEDTVTYREFLGAMQPTSRMNETEKLLLKRYKENIRILDEKEKLIEEQERIIETATGDELTKAKNRLDIYRTQANRARRALTAAERDNGFARLMATAYSTLNRIPVGTADNVADATDALEKDIANLTSQLKTIEASVSRTAAGQKAAFARGLFDRKQLNTVAQALKGTYGSRMSTVSIADRLALAYSEIYADSGADGAKRFSEAARSLAEDLIRNNKYRFHSDLLPMLTESIGTISLSETDIQEIKNAGLTVRQYKAMLAPYVKVTASGSDLSSYVSNAEYYGNGTLASIFSDGSEGDYAMKLYEIISNEKAKEDDNGFEGRSEGQLAMDAMADIAGSILPLADNSNAFAQLRSEMLKYAGENAEAARAVSTAIERAKSASRKATSVWHAAVKDATLAHQAAEYYRNLEEQRRVVELLEQKQLLTEQLRGEAGKLLKASQEKYQQQIDEIRRRRDINVEIGKRTRHIKRIVKRLNDRIIHEEDYKNVKEPLKPAVIRLVKAFIDGFGNLVFYNPSDEAVEKGAKPTIKAREDYEHLKFLYDKLADDDAAPEFYSDDVANWLSELSDMKEWDALIRAEGSSSLGAAEEKLAAYSRVAEIADHIYKLVTAADEIFIDGKREKFNAFSAETGTALIEHKDSKLLVGKARDAYNAFQNLLVKGNLTPQFFFEHLKNSGMTRLFDGLMRGQTEYAQAIREGQEAISDAKKRYNFYSWQNMKEGVQFRTEQGHDIALTVPQMMWVYATAKREATNKLMDTHHLDQGGFRYEAKDLPKQKGKMSAIPGSDRLHKLSQADVEKISNTLTEEQKACADELVSYLSNECAAQGNRASMELFGIKKYNEEYYFPFKTASDQRYQRSDAGAASTTNDARVKHTSFTHSLRKGANTPLVMGDFFDVIADHINLMATYSSFVVPIESMNRVMNTKINEEVDGSGNDVTIRSLIGRKYGEASQKYIADLLKDLNGGPQTDSRGGLSALFRTFKRGAVMGSLSVTLQQPTAIVRAFAYVNPKYFAHITMEGNKKTWERMMKHSGTAVIKEMGKFDVGTGHMANDWIANSDIQEYNVLKRARFLMKTEGWKAAKDNTIEFLTSLPGVMDRITWTHIWKAVEAEQADQHPGMDRNSDEFLDMVGKRFDDVINHTQVYDSVLAKSQNMRSKNPLTQMSTAFMSEPTLNANLYYSAVTGDHTAGKRAGIVTSVIASNLLAAAMASLISAWNKDDDDRKFTEKYLAAFASRAVDNLNPMTMYPYLSDLWSMVSGYDIERTDMSVVQDIWNYGSSFMKKLVEGEDITWRDRENFYGTIANLFGIPGKNVSRDIRRIRNLITTDKSASSPSAIKYTLYENAIPLGLWKDSNKAYCQRLVAAVVDGDKQEAYDLWDYLTNTKKPSQNTINTNIRDELKRRVQEGSLAPEQATEILRKYAPYKNDKDNLNKPKEWAE